MTRAEILEARRPVFEAAVIERMKEGGYLEVEIRVECLPRSGDGYYDGSVDAYWHFWNTALDGVVIDLSNNHGGDIIRGSERMFLIDAVQAVEAATLQVKL